MYELHKVYEGIGYGVGRCLAVICFHAKFLAFSTDLWMCNLIAKDINFETNFSVFG